MVSITFVQSSLNYGETARTLQREREREERRKETDKKDKRDTERESVSSGAAGSFVCVLMSYGGLLEEAYRP